MWFYFSLASAVFTAIMVIIHRQLSHRVRLITFMWVKSISVIPIVALFAFRNGIPQVNFLFFVGAFGSAFLYTLAKFFSFKAMRLDDLSKIYPLAILSPIITLSIATLPPLSETPSSLSIIGVFVTLFGAYLLNIQKAKEGVVEPFKALLTNNASAFMLLSIMTIGVVMVFDKLAIKNTFPQTSALALLTQDIIIAIALTPLLFTKVKNWKEQVFSNKKLFLLLIFLGAISNLLTFASIGGGNVGLVATIVRTQVLFVLLFSYLLFKDKPKKEILIGTVIMIAGVVLIKIGS